MRRRIIELYRLFPLLLLPGLAGCAIFSAAPHYRGNAVSAHQLKQLTPGVSTESDATALLGSPTLRETFDRHHWLYVSQITKRRIAQTQGVVRQKVVMLKFNDAGVLQSIKDVGKKQAVRVAMAGGHTPAPGGHASLFQELVGGVGHYNPTGIGAGPGGFGGTGQSDIGGASGSGGGLSGF